MTEGAMVTARRGLLTAAAAGAALAVGACAKGDEAKPVSPVEDLMRQHAVLGRVLVIYREAAALVRANFSSVDAKPIWRAAELVRRFGEAFHEPLEEAQIFPEVMKVGGAAASLIPILIGQHARGRQITAFVQAKTASGAVAGTDAEPLAQALESYARMFEAHFADEDTLVLEAWGASLSKSQLADAGRQFADAGKAAFNGDPFAFAMAEIAAIEAALRIGDLRRYTAPAPGEAPQGVLPTPPGLQEGGD
jgi:hemerythrin-like domain-containing protein